MSDWNTPSVVHRITLSAGASEIVTANAVSVRPLPPTQSRVVHHRVRRGETLSHIARYAASLEEILEANGLSKTSVIRAGTTRLIPKF